MQKFFATCPKGLENLLFNELKALQASSVKETVAGVAFSGNMQTAMRVCLYSRFASRVLLSLNTFKCSDDTDLYLGALGIAYEQYFSHEKTIAVSFNGTSAFIRNTQYGALRVKDAICDRFNSCKLPRPDVNKQRPDVHIIATLKKGEVSISLDLSGTAQFFREYHRSTGSAPLKENLAATMVARAGYTGSQNLVDPMCGSATLLLEAALIATDTAPGIMRENYGFRHLTSFDQEAWQAILEEAHTKAREGKAKALAQGIHFYGFDADSAAVARAQQNVQKAGFSELISIEHCALEQLTNPCKDSNLPCIVVTNPPYGERMGNFNELIMLYTLLGHKLKQEFAGASAAVISSSTELLSCLRLAGDKFYRLYNGALECQLRVFKLAEGAKGASEATSASSATSIDVAIAPDFANRLKKNLKNLEKWAVRNDISAYRVYDADLPEYNAAIDRYSADFDYYVIQEYQAPASIKEHTAKQRLLDMIAATIKVTGTAGEMVIVKSREKQKGDAQYVKSEQASHNFLTVHEGEVKFRVNLHDYLDTGLFLDARPIRRLIASLAPAKDFLNLFAYTSTVSVMAALAGAKSTTSVDMSRTYLDWAMENFKLNKLELNNKQRFVQADCLAYLSSEQAEKYDLIYIDPPTFSNSKRMEKSFDVQRDHLQMLANLTRHLKDEGIVIFCTNKRNFKLDDGLEYFGFSVENITKQTFDPDFKRDPNLHTCFKLTYSRAKQSKEPEALVTNTLRPRWSGELDKNKSRFSYQAKDDQGQGSSHDKKAKFLAKGQGQERFERNERRGKVAKPVSRERRVFGAGGIRLESVDPAKQEAKPAYSKTWGKGE